MIISCLLASMVMRMRSYNVYVRRLTNYVVVLWKYMRTRKGLNAFVLLWF